LRQGAAEICSAGAETALVSDRAALTRDEEFGLIEDLLHEVRVRGVGGGSDGQGVVQSI
jgi:hypothetical protein